MPKVIATDLDGTLFFPKRRLRMISDRSIKFIRRFIDAGNRFILVSGRNIEYCRKVQKRIKRPVDIIGCNGAYIYIDDELVKESYFDNQKIDEIVRDIQDKYQPATTSIMTANKNFFPKRENSFINLTFFRLYSFFEFVYKEKFNKSLRRYREAFRSGKIYKVLFVLGITTKAKLQAKELNKIFREQYKDELESSWSNQGIELSPKGCSKAEGLKYYSDYLMINPSDIYVVGDSGNDISMFKAFHNNSFCMARSPLSVSKHAKHVIRHFWELEKYI